MEKTKILFLIYILSLSIFTHAEDISDIRALFTFGDSFLDSGNNNHYLDTTKYRSDHFPYGRDLYIKKATGRFSNGKLITDLIATDLQIAEFISPYLDPKTEKSLSGYNVGVSFASAGSGLDKSPSHNNVIEFPKQLEFFHEYINKVGTTNANRIFNKAVAFVTAGTDEFINLSPERLGRSESEYHDLLIAYLESYLKNITEAGIKKIIVIGLPPIGCLPIHVKRPILPILSGLKCDESLNIEAQNYNIKLQAFTDTVSQTLNARVLYTDIYYEMLHFITSPGEAGFEHTHKGCCGTGNREIGPTCNSVVGACSDASKYVFWDAVNPTEEVYKTLANGIRERMNALF